MRQPDSLTEDGVKKFRQQGYWQGRLFVDLIDSHATVAPEKIAIIEASTQTRLSYQQLHDQTKNLAASLVRLGIGKSDVVSIQAPNWPELVICHLALNRIGAVFLPLHHGFREADIKHLLEHTNAKAFIYPGTYKGFDYRVILENIKDQLPDLQKKVVMRENPLEGELSFEALASDSSWVEQFGDDFLEEHRPDSVESRHIMVSSGTTSKPKCAVYCDDATIFKIVQQYGKFACHLTSDDIAAAIAPAGTGATGYSFPVMAPLLFGGTSVLLEHWSSKTAKTALDLIETYRCTYAVMIPTQLIKLLNIENIEDYDLTCLRFITTAGAKLLPDTALEAERQFSCMIQNLYGTTDAGVATLTSVDDSPQQRLTEGRPPPGQELRIIDSDGRLVKSNEAGEICWRGPNQSYGFFNAPEENEKIWDDEGWYHSGDIGTLDDSGYLTIVGRKKDMIIRGGQNIHPGQIEEIMYRHRKVVEVAVIPVSHEVLGEIACAVILPTSLESPPSLNELNQSILDEGLPVWSQPERVLFVKDFPRNPGGKVDKRALICKLARLDLSG